MNWFTSDQHFNHFNIINHTNRPFWTWQGMNAELIRRHNSRVQPSHNVYHVGDLKFGANGPNVYEILKQLNGNHILLKGNHDNNNGNNTILQYCIIKTYGKVILLTHKPDDALMMMSENPRIDLAFVGHVHHNWKFKNNMINIGVDVWDFFPIDAKQALKAYYKWEKENQ